MRREQATTSGGTELGRYLRTRRARLNPAEAGFEAQPGRRRIPGLRREELATLAGISIDYYTRLEQGRETRPSPSVVDSLARALHLEQEEHEHLRSLALIAARGPAGQQPAPSRSVRPGVELLLESLRPNPAYVVSRTNDVLACNPGGLRLLPGMEDWPAGKRNITRYAFLHPAARDLFADDWHNQIRGGMAQLRVLAGTEPDAPDLARLVDELLLKSPEFARMWDRYEVRVRAHGNKIFHHPEAGTLTLGFQAMELEGTPGHRLLTFCAGRGTTDHDGLVLLDMAAQQGGAGLRKPRAGYDDTAPSAL
ncbi:helix-turn-helix transcriptional regulator [Streptomyces fuscichromogenes]|uniref:Transcriptional regulator n=1 Tax=Streptomyces fuscichromogenes TaxID=1324013 RepID=A0A918CWM3_9ACTN|nr:helix-turn-helix transcriptional regulator [Streptomyces fuscichromogenes]GGN40423.1 transcriptional regulator [Streptomyces fuscichromogenes]